MLNVAIVLILQKKNAKDYAMQIHDFMKNLKIGILSGILYSIQ